MIALPCRLVLASVSPRRREMLERAGYVFDVVDPGEAEEQVAAAETPDALAIAKARVKAHDVAARLGPPYPAIVVAADTIVALGGDVIGKPLDRADAVAILKRLSGTRQRVISGLCLWPVTGNAAAPAPRLAAATTWVRMRPMSDREIADYVASGESDGKAGAYAIQEGGDRFVESLDGSFANVVGFPLEMFEELLPRVLREWKMG